ncbi:hypothetical protein IPG37_04710 [bacterium]|nr:MAG: hypothetical protein IPG37_04710 [bacterium]QQR63129.1 MAG: hypothetical protein IPH67_01480 [bacterium]
MSIIHNTVDKAFENITNGIVTLRMMQEAFEIETDADRWGNREPVLKNDDPVLIYKYIANNIEQFFDEKLDQKVWTEEMEPFFLKKFSSQELDSAFLFIISRMIGKNDIYTVLKKLKQPLLEADFIRLTYPNLLNNAGSLSQSKERHDEIDKFVKKYIEIINTFMQLSESHTNITRLIALLEKEYSVLNEFLPSLQVTIKNDWEQFPPFGNFHGSTLSEGAQTNTEELLDKITYDSSRLLYLENKNIMSVNKTTSSALEYIKNLLKKNIIKNNDDFDDILESMLQATPQELEIIYPYSIMRV